jgi:uncharacterized membrane protein YkoI
MKFLSTFGLCNVKTSPEDAVKKAEETYKGQKLKGISFENSNGEWVISPFTIRIFK